jgi:cytochrome c
LIASSDCKACHTVESVSVGPSYFQVSQRYKNQPDAMEKLTEKIIAGGGGSWGTEHVMSAHPQLQVQEVNEMVKYILSISDTKKPKVNLSTRGTVPFNQHKEEEFQGRYTLTAEYTDKGANGIEPITSREVVTLRNAKVKPIYADAHVGFARFGKSLANGDHKSYILLKNIDLAGIKSFTYEYASQNRDGEIEVRIDSQAGPIIASGSYLATGAWNEVKTFSSKIATATTGRHDVFFFMIKRQKPNEDIINLKSITFNQ